MIKANKLIDKWKNSGYAKSYAEISRKHPEVIGGFFTSEFQIITACYQNKLKIYKNN